MTDVVFYYIEIQFIWMMVMKRFSAFFICIVLSFSLLGCSGSQKQTQIVATTLPVYEFTTALCSGTHIQVAQLITESVSCLHDYNLQVSQMRLIEDCQTLIISGAGFEDFLEKQLLENKQVIDASKDVPLLCSEEAHHGDHHHHAQDSHIWLSIENAKMMAENIYLGLVNNYPEKEDIFHKNFSDLSAKLDELQTYADAQLKSLCYRDIITFHDGFSYMAEDFGLHIVKAIEEESGSEASAKELIDLANIITENQLPAIFTERNGSLSAAEIIANETGVGIFSLDMAISGSSYFEAIKHNIDTLKEALG